MAATLFQFFKILKNITAADFDNFPVLATNEERGKLKKKINLKKKMNGKIRNLKFKWRALVFCFLFHRKSTTRRAPKKKKDKMFLFLFFPENDCPFFPLLLTNERIAIVISRVASIFIGRFVAPFSNFGPFSLKQSLKKSGKLGNTFL